MSLWIEQFPTHFVMMPYGYVNVTISTKTSPTGRVVKSSQTYQLTTTLVNLTGLTLTADFTGTNEQLSLLNSNDFARGVGKLPPYEIEGYPTGLSGFPCLLVGIPNLLMSRFLQSNFVSRCCALQTRSVVYKKVKLRFFYSKARASVNGSGTLDSLREYQSFNFTCSPTVCGVLPETDAMAVGAIGINQYIGTVTEGTAPTRGIKAQDKPGRVLIRGCGISEEDALRGSTMVEIASFLEKGGTLQTGAPWSLVPVVGVLNDLWYVRAAVSAGYVRVASQKGLDPTVRTNGGSP